METNEINPVEEKATAMELQVESIAYLNETRKWTVFLSILGFVFLGLLVIIALFTGTILSTFGGNSFAGTGAGAGIAIGFMYLLIGLLYFFPIFYLYKFSTLAKRAFTTNNSSDLSLAFKNLKSHYKFIGILTIVILAFYLLVILIVSIAGGISAFM